jgi:pimeloyl-ACP methyl ester carboxylesterase
MSEAPVRRSMTAADGTALSYLAQGSGPPVLLLHGFCSSAAGWWKTGVAQRLAQTRRVLAPDIRGHGDSARPTDASAYGRRLLSDLEALLDHNDLETADVAGFSMGAEIGLAFAVHRSDRVLSLTLAGSGWSPEGIVAEYRRWFDALSGTSDTPDALAALIEGIPEITGLPEEAVAALAMPVFGIIGERDGERPYMERLARVLPGFRHVVLPGADHLDTWRSAELPDLVARAVNGKL